jgi:uncharacterized protein
MVSQTALYAAPLVLLFMALSAYVIVYRRGNRLPLGDAGDAGDAELLARIRAQGNCAEYMPVGLILLLIAEQAGPGVLFHLAGITLLVGRFVHAGHLAILRRSYVLRPVAIFATFTSYLLALAAALF